MAGQGAELVASIQRILTPLVQGISVLYVGAVGWWLLHYLTILEGGTSLKIGAADGTLTVTSLTFLIVAGCSIIMGFLAGEIALSKGREGTLWFILCTILAPAGLALLRQDELTEAEQLS